MLRTGLLYVVAALAEIGGCYAVWMIIKRDASRLWVFAAVLLLAIFAWLLTRTDQNFAGRAFAAYGGIYVAASLAWLCMAEGGTLTRSDMLGGTLVIIGAGVILAGGLKP
jgi:small multidrug resistance family-3 protein